MGWNQWGLSTGITKEFELVQACKIGELLASLTLDSRRRCEYNHLTVHDTWEKGNSHKVTKGVG